MKALTTLVIALTLSFPVYSTEAAKEIQQNSKVVDWIRNIYEMRIRRDAYDRVQQQTDNQCDTKILWYKQEVDKYPESEYLKGKLETWTERCE